MIEAALVKSDRRHGGRRLPLGDLQDDVLSAGVDANRAEIGRAAGILAHAGKIAWPFATWGELCTGVWGRNRDAA